VLAVEEWQACNREAVESAEEHRVKRKRVQTALKEELASADQAIDRLRQEKRVLIEGDDSWVPKAKYDDCYEQLQQCKERVQSQFMLKADALERLDKKVHLPVPAPDIQDLQHGLENASDLLSRREQESAQMKEVLEIKSKQLHQLAEQACRNEADALMENISHLKRIDDLKGQLRRAQQIERARRLYGRGKGKDKGCQTYYHFDPEPRKKASQVKTEPKAKKAKAA
jgi:hypothetical protein